MEIYSSESNRQGRSELPAQIQRRSVIRGFFHNQSKNSTNNQSKLFLKRQNFRQVRRRQQLQKYFQKKRVQYFGWQQGTIQPPLRQNQDIQIDSFETQIRNDNSQTQHHFVYDSLLEQLISQGQGDKQSQARTGQHTFKYGSFCQFLVQIIGNQLNSKFRNKFQNQQQFIAHFNYLKAKVYERLAEQLQTFFKQFQQFNSSHNKSQAWAFQQILSQTYKKLIFQLHNFIHSGNLISSLQDQACPKIRIEQQVCYLLKMTIQATYYDDCGCLFQSQDYQEQNYGNLNKKYNRYFAPDQTYNAYSNHFSVTKFIVQQTDILQSLRFLLDFGPPINPQEKWSQIQDSKQIFRKQKITILIVALLGNIALNIGSDVLFQKGFVYKLKVMLEQPYFKVNIRSISLNILFKNHQRPISYLKIQQLLLNSFQLLRKQKSLQYLTEIDSFQSALDILEQISKVKGQKQENKIKSQVILVDRQIILLEQNEQQDSCFDENQIIQQEGGNAKTTCPQLEQLQNQCFKCLEYHFILGEFKVKQCRSQPKTNSTQIFDSSSIQSRMRLDKECKNLSFSNPYLVKLEYSNGQTILQQFQRGKQLLKSIYL